jgi:diguanylate cyclase
VAVTGGDSGGVALSAELLLSRADAAMYQAKAAGKAQFALS